MPKIIIMPSLLAADMGRLAEECRRAEAAGADALHVDIMDGHFVPNLSLGPDIVKMARASVKIPLDTHLMVTHPQDLTAGRSCHPSIRLGKQLVQVVIHR